MKILLVEDNRLLGNSVKQGLEELGWVVDLAIDGEEGLFLANNSAYQVFLIDRMLPKIGGMELISSLRAAGMTAPAIIVTARGSLEDRVSGLEVADDYVVKPFEMAELVARIRAVHRRYLGKTETGISCGKLLIDPGKRQVLFDGAALALTQKEFELLEILAGSVDHVYSRIELHGFLYSYESEPESNSLDVLLARLRKKIAGSGVDIETVRSKGFVLHVAKTSA